MSALNALPFAEGSRQVVPADGPARACPACGTLRTTDLGLPRQDAALRATPARAIAAALPLIPGLTPRERAIFELLGIGYDNRLIARTFEISERTVKRHVTAILSKLKLESRLQAGLAALIVSSGTPESASWPDGRTDLPADSGA